jgi:CRISPR-associated endonuclease/helicase Cas3
MSAGAPLAKSAWLPTPAAAAAARRAAGLPERWRHEAQSVTRAIADPRLAQAHDRELVLWLIGTHHGFGRPLFPHDDPRERPDALGPQRLDFQFEGRDWPQIFEALKARYGPWELARLEAVLRLADHRASEEADA